MPRRCCVPGCHSNYNTQSNYTSAFLFPKDDIRRKKWIAAINRKDFIPGVSAVVCIHHFDERYIIREDKFVQKDGSILSVQRKKLTLSDEAYPTLFQNQPNYLTKTLPKERKDPSERRAQLIERDNEHFAEWCEADNIDSFSTLKNALKDKVVDPWMFLIQDNAVFIYKLDISECLKVTVTLKIQDNLIIRLYYDNVGIDTKHILSFVLGSELKLEKWSQLDCVLSFLKSFKLNGMNIENKLSTVKLLLNEIIESDVDDGYTTKVKFIYDQLVLAFSKQHRYASEIILWAAKLYFSYPAAYAMVRESGILTLPHQSYLRNLTASLNINGECGSTNNHIQYLKQKVKMLEEHEKVVNVLLDEIYISPTVDYKGGNVVGIADNFEESVAASTVQTFMISSIFSKNKDVVSLIPVKNLTADQLYNYTLKVINLLHQCGYIVLCLISDNNRINRNMFAAMCGGNLTSCIINPHDVTKKIFFLFDTPHLIKSVRNNWLNQNSTNQTFFHPDPGNLQQINIASLQHLKQIYDSEKNLIIKSAPKLNRKVLFPTPIERQNVKHALSLFHESNVVALEQKSVQFPDFIKTKYFLEHLQRWWKIVNCKHPNKGKRTRDPYSDAITNTDHHNVTFLKEFLKWLEKWKSLNDLSSSDKAVLLLPEKGGMLSRETEFALTHTTKTLINLIEYVFENLQAKYVLLAKFQTDSLEARFGQFRQMSGGNYNISYRQIIESEKKLKIINLIKLHSKKFGEFTIKSLDCSETSEKQTGISEDLEYFSDVIRLSQNVNISASTESVLLYIAGYVALKAQNGIICSDCIAILSTANKLEWESSSEEITKYMQLIDRGGLKWPKQFTMDIVLTGYKIFDVLISDTYEGKFLKHGHQKNIVTNLAMENIILSNSIFINMCSCGISSDVLVKKCLSVMANILINNYCKAKNEKLLKSKSNKRKLLPLLASTSKKL